MHSARMLERIEDLSGPTGAHVETEHHVTWKIRKVYLCPRDTFAQRGNRNACGRQCRNARGEADDEYEDEVVLTVLEMRKTTMLDPKMCVEQC